MGARSALILALIFGTACGSAPAAVGGADAGTAADDAVASDDDAVAPGDASTADAGDDRDDAAIETDSGAIGEDAEAPADASGPINDLDGDGLDDEFEARIAADYLPFRAVHPDDACALGAILFRVYPHPDAPATRLLVIIDAIFERDCGTSGHIGDNEVSAMTIDPSLPAPEGILALRAIAHQSTPCQKITECGPCRGANYSACTTAQRPGRTGNYPVIFYSRGKHGSYLSEPECDNACFFTNQCELPSAPDEPQMINLGEPDLPSTRDLTTAGVITSTNGWTASELFDYDPWGASDFGGAGSVMLDMVDPAFVTPACE